MKGSDHTLVFHRGRFADAARKRVPVLERGFLYGDGVFETLRTYARRPFHLTAHLARLRRSASALGITLTQKDTALARVVADGISKIADGEATVREVSVRMVATRGVSALTYTPPDQPHPELYVFFSPLPPRKGEVIERGVSVLTLVEEKPARFATVKLMNGVPSILALATARERGAYEVLRVARDGRVLEGFISNVFAVRGRTLTTPPVADGVLDGVTRSVVLQVARTRHKGSRGLEVREESLELARALTSDELFLTHTSAGVVPVVAVDDRPIGSGRPGDVTRELSGWFESLPAHPDRVAGETFS